jgi:hypothetical protein
MCIPEYLHSWSPLWEDLLLAFGIFFCIDLRSLHLFAMSQVLKRQIITRPSHFKKCKLLATPKWPWWYGPIMPLWPWPMTLQCELNLDIMTVYLHTKFHVAISSSSKVMVKTKQLHIWPWWPWPLTYDLDLHTVPRSGCGPYRSTMWAGLL